MFVVNLLLGHKVSDSFTIDCVTDLIILGYHGKTLVL